MRGRRILLGAAATSSAVVALPRFLPARVVALRMWIFARINGTEGVSIPGPLVDASQFKRLYSDPAANGRSRGAKLSDLFWYWLSPGAHVHQEHLEAGERYDQVADCTRRILHVPTQRMESIVARHTAEACRAAGQARTTAVRLRDLMMPVWAGVFAEIVFGAGYPPQLRDLAVANANDVVTALKCCGLRHMDRRERLTRFLAAHIHEVPQQLPAALSPEERALYLQGTFFNTAVVQMSEATAHLLMALAQHPELQEQIATARGDHARQLLDHVMTETLRLYPLFGVAHRITTDDIVVDAATTLSAGSVLCFSYPEFHRQGFPHADRFDPSRWHTTSAKDASFIPFGVAANRPCPAWHLAPVALRAATRELLRHASLRSSAAHTRSLPNRGPCLLTPRSPQHGDSPGWLHLRLDVMRLRDRWEDVWRSLVQLVLGTYMVWDARRQRLCERYFESLAEAEQAGRAA